MNAAIVKIYKAKSWFFEKINKPDNQPDLSRKQRRKIKSGKLGKEKENQE